MRPGGIISIYTKIHTTLSAYLLVVKKNLAIVAHLMRILCSLHISAHWGWGNVVLLWDMHLLKLLLILPV